MRMWFAQIRKSLHSMVALTLLVAGVLPAQAQLGGPPLITVQPIGISVQKGGTAVFAVVALSLTGMSYQWYQDGKKVNKATSAIFTINNVSNGNTGNYTVVISNASGSVTSSAAVLSIGNVV